MYGVKSPILVTFNALKAARAAVIGVVLKASA